VRCLPAGWRLNVTLVLERRKYLDALSELLDGRKAAVWAELGEQVTDNVEDWLDSSIPGASESFFCCFNRLFRLAVSGAGTRKVNEHPEADAPLSLGQACLKHVSGFVGLFETKETSRLLFGEVGLIEERKTRPPSIVIVIVLTEQLDRSVGGSLEAMEVTAQCVSAGLQVGKPCLCVWRGFRGRKAEGTAAVVDLIPPGMLPLIFGMAPDLAGVVVLDQEVDTDQPPFALVARCSAPCHRGQSRSTLRSQLAAGDQPVP